MFSNYLALHKKDFQSVAYSRQGGFGLIELMVSISIMTIVSSVILVRQSSFNSAVLLRNQTYDIALSVREVQLSALTTGDNRGDFRAILGVHFDTSAPSVDEYKIFRDQENPSHNGFYDLGEEFGLQGVLDNRFEIRSIRTGATTQTALSVIFVRPNFDAQFVNSSGLVAVESVEIDIARKGAIGSSDDVLRTLEITSAGQITVQ